MSYTIDVYRNEAPIQKNIFSLSTFVTLFPQLVAGPIVRYSDAKKSNPKIFPSPIAISLYPLKSK